MTSTQRVTSQGEFITVEHNKDVAENTTTAGVLSGLWNKVKESTAVHVAEMAATIMKEKAQEAVDAVVAAEHVGEKLVGQLPELLSDLQHKGVEQAAEVVEKVVEVNSTLVDLSESVVGLGQEKATELYNTAAQTATSVKETIVEKTAEVLDLAEQKTNEVMDVIEAKSSPSESTTPTNKPLSADAPAFEPTERLKLLVDGTAPAPATVLPRSASFKRSPSKLSVVTTATELGWNEQPLTLTMDVVSHIQRIADRTGDAVLHETARRAHSACAKGLSEAPGVHLTWITPQQANDLVNLAIRTQDHELADFARYCQSVAATTHIGVEPTPGKIKEEILKGFQELKQQGRVHNGPGYGAAFASVNRSYSPEGAAAPAPVTTSTPAPSTGDAPKKSQKQGSVNQGSQTNQPDLVLTMEVVSHIQRIADRTGNAELHETARKAHSACAKGLSECPGVHLTWITPQQASELMNLASKTLDSELVDFARYCQSVAATTQIGVEPTPGKIQQEIIKGRELQQKAQSASA